MNLFTSTPTGHKCAPWCRGHDPEVPELCWGPDEGSGTNVVGLTYDPASGSTTVSVLGHPEMSLPQAKTLLVALQRQVDRAGNGVSITPTCAPWCSEHRDGGPTPEDQLCRHTITSAAFGEILLSYSLDDGPMVNLYCTEEELTFPDAEVLARVILAVLAGHKGGEAL